MKLVRLFGVGSSWDHLFLVVVVLASAGVALVNASVYTCSASGYMPVSGQFKTGNHCHNSGSLKKKKISIVRGKDWFVWLLEFYILATSEVKSGRVPTCI